MPIMLITDPIHSSCHSAVADTESPYEQNTQQSPAFGLSTSAHAGQSRKNWHASTGMVTVLRCPQLGQVSWQSSFMSLHLVWNHMDWDAILARPRDLAAVAVSRMAGVPANRDWPTLAPCRVPPPALAAPAADRVPGVAGDRHASPCRHPGVAGGIGRHGDGHDGMDMTQPAPHRSTARKAAARSRPAT